MRLIACLAAVLTLSGCGLVHKIDVQQGNYVPEDVAAKVQVGMTKPQVRALLGTPLLNDVFHANRWDYYFSSSKGGKAADRTRYSVFFENDKVVSWTGQARPALPPPVTPGGSAPAPASPAPAAATPAPPAAATPAPAAPPAPPVATPLAK